MHRVASVEPLENSRLRISFTDGLTGEVDLSDIVGEGVFSALVDPVEFAKVFLDPRTHTVAWPGDIDLCPDSLYQDVLSQQRAA